MAWPRIVPLVLGWVAEFRDFANSGIVDHIGMGMREVVYWAAGFLCGQTSSKLANRWISSVT